MKFYLMTRPNWQGVFTRTVQAPAGDGVEKVKKLSFDHLEAVEVSEAELKVLLPDLGKALLVAKFDEKGRPRPDWDKTTRLVEGEEIESVFANLPPIVDEGEVDAELIPVDESLIPTKHHAALKKANLHTLQSIAMYLENHEDLTGIEGIGDASNREIMEALEAHAELAE